MTSEGENKTRCSWQRGAKTENKKSRARMTRDRGRAQLKELFKSCSPPPPPPSQASSSMAFLSSMAAQPNLASSSSAGPLLGSVNGSKLRQTQAASKPAPVLDLPALQAASQVLQEQLVKDSQIVPDLGELICECASRENVVHTM